MNTSNMTLDEVTKELSLAGCSDGGCVVRKPTGQHTNGGCQCVPGEMLSLDDRRRIKNWLLLRQREVELLCAVLSKADEMGREIGLLSCQARRVPLSEADLADARAAMFAYRADREGNQCKKL